MRFFIKLSKTDKSGFSVYSAFMFFALIIFGVVSCGRTGFFEESAVCGDGILQEGEECDGLDFGGKTCESLGYEGGVLLCLSDCRLDTTWCEGEGPSCGNGVIDAGEDCDGTNLGGQTCESLGYERGKLACGDNCRFDATDCEGIGPVCGNGVIEYGESCDSEDLGGQSCESLGYERGELLCGSDCLFDVSDCDGGSSSCGNGVKEDDEECDGWDLGGQSCESLGYDGGVLYCSALCELETSGCFKEDCGNGVIEPGEDCDGDNLGGLSCEALGYEGGVLDCTDFCSYDVNGCYSFECGNGLLEPGEECDGWDLGGETCESLGYDGGFLYCSELCQLETSGCFKEDCGNGVIDPGEECDGSDLGGESCESQGFDGGILGCTDLCTFDDSTCFKEDCGNGVIDPGEDCDGNNLGGASCELLGYDWGELSCTNACSFDESECHEFLCGNGILDPGEECDGGNLGGQSCESLGYDGGNLVCSPNCTLNTFDCRNYECGDGVSDPGEECDDGNNSNFDECLNDCTVAQCGDGYLWWGVESCDDGNNIDCDGCKSDCSRPDSICGDGIRECGEECDGSDVGGFTCEFLGYDGGVLGCNSGCSFDVSDCYSYECGNGVLDPGEDCDGGDLGGATCVSLGYDAGTLSCTLGCSYDVSGCVSFQCGNGVLDPGEQCDGGDLGGQTCESLGYDGGILACSGDCTFDTSGCYSLECGNGVLDPGEQCDGGDLGGQTCESLGYDGGNLACYPDCTLDTSDCFYDSPLCVPDWTLSCNGSDWWSTENWGATEVVDSYSCVGWDESGPEYAYTFQPQESSEVTVQLSEMSQNLDVFVLDGTDGCDPQNCIAHGNNRAVFQAEAGRTYYVVVDGRNGVSGSYRINLYCASCGNGTLEFGEECDEGPANEDRFGLEVRQDDGLFMPIQPIQRWTNAVNFYAFVSASAHTGYEAVGRSLALLYRDYTTGVMSLFLIHGIDRTTTGEIQPTAEVEFEVFGLPEGTSLGISDDPGEFYIDSPTSFYGDWWFKDNTDGGIIEGISYPNGWEIVVRPTWNYGLWEWVWVDQDSHIHQLDMNKDLHIRAYLEPVLCRADCTLPICGDGILDPGEVCDDGNNNDGDGCASDCMSMP